MESSTIPRAMRDVPNPQHMPANLRYIFDTDSRKARQVVITTTYATHRNRARLLGKEFVPGVSYNSPRHNPETGKEMFEMEPTTQTFWKTRHEGRYSLLVADETQRAKNPETDTWSVLRVHEFPKTILATATPMLNAAQSVLRTTTTTTTTTITPQRSCSVSRALRYDQHPALAKLNPSKFLRGAHSLEITLQEDKLQGCNRQLHGLRGIGVSVMA
ncbi:hypothetical protein BDW59DRAFT_28333 [Aspergillus cavernicola]|uniref:SNF2 N-terminal domain-containing protein n=1 Tax=Aspergillus cavernicola TaxID=176166 RepID=A0ABR4ISZ7_9EURO